jgi:DNA-binding NtrC family response regulator
VRLISATNADLKTEIAAGRFREDLYFRLNVIELRVPALHQRPEDVELLARHFLARHSAGRTLALTPEASLALEQHDWPGNVRELDNRIQRAVLVCENGPIQPSHLGLSERESNPVPLSAPAFTPSGAPPASVPASAPFAPNPLADAERAVVESALERAQGVVSRAAAELGLSRQALYRRMDRLGIAIERRVR